MGKFEDKHELPAEYLDIKIDNLAENLKDNGGGRPMVGEADVKIPARCLTIGGRIADILMILIVLAALIACMVYTVQLPKASKSYFENRTLAVLPEASDDTVLDGSYFSALETYLCDHSVLREDIMKKVTDIDINIIKRPVVNEIVVQDNILLPFNKFESVDEAVVQAQAEAVTNNQELLKQITEENGGEYISVAVPCQYAYCEDLYPWYLNNREAYTSSSLKAWSKCLDEKGVSHIDLGEAYRAEGEPMEYTSAVDNHYSIFGAFKAYQTIMDYINSERSRALPVLESDDVEFEPVDYYYMGSRTRKLFNLVKNTEHLYKMELKRPIEYTRSNGEGNSVAKVYEMPKVRTDSIAYTMYMGGDLAETEINTKRSNLPTVMIYGDSFTNAMECILYTSFDKMYSLDMRYYKNGSIAEFIEDKQPDYVIYLRDYESLLSTEGNGEI